MRTAPATAGNRRRHLLGGGRVLRLADLLEADASHAAQAAHSASGEPVGRAVAVVMVDFAPVALGSVTRRASGLLGWRPRGADVAVVAGLDRAGRPVLEVETQGVVAAAPADTPSQQGAWRRYAVLVAPDTVELYVDAARVGALPWPAGPVLDPREVVVGSRHDAVSVGGVVPAEGVTGVLGEAELVWFADVATARAHVGERGAAAGADLDVVAELARWRRPDPYRPTYHFQPPAHWMNEPHGPIEVDGLHHVFFQANRLGPYWGAIEWGHAVSRDLVHWRHLPPALSPVQARVAPDGIWSGGSVLDDHGCPLLFFTAGNAGERPDQSVAVARPLGRGEGTTWVADDEPLIRMPLDPDLVPGQFRDPFVWRENGRWFMLVGAGLVGRGGTALLYTSRHGDHWRECGPLLTADAATHPEVGEMWELPVLLPVTSPDGRRAHVLLVCPWWQTVPEGRVVEVVHWVGDWDPDALTFTPRHPEPQRLDVGRHFTGPSGNVLADGRTILWSIAQDGRTTAQQAEVGWAHNAGLPLELGLGEDDTLTVRPLRELEALRGKAVVDLADVEVPGPEAALLAEAPMGPVEVDLRCSATSGTVRCELGADGTSSHTVLEIDCGTAQLVMQRPGAAAYDGWSPTERDGGLVDLVDGEVRLRLFVDGSMVEAYVNERTALTTRIRPRLDTALRVLAPVGGVVHHLRVWPLRPADTPTGPA